MGKTAVIGAGPAGLAAAYQLCKAGHEVEVLEASGNVGGMAKSLDLWGQKVDLGPHRFFSKNPRVRDFFFEVLQDDYCWVPRKTRILYENKFFNYPLQPFNALKKLGPASAAGCLFSFLQQRMRKEKNIDDNFESWLIHNFGEKLYKIFFQSYSEKLWGLPCHELDVDFARQRIRDFSFSKILKQFIQNKSTDRTAVTQFAYPKKGSGMTYEKMAEFIRSCGCKIYLNEKVMSISTAGSQIKELRTENQSFEAENYISSMPLTHLVNNLDSSSQKAKDLSLQLSFRNTLLVYFLINSEDLFEDNWIYVQSPNLKLGRVTNYRNWSPDLYTNSKQSILSLEFWCDNDGLWTASEEEIFSLAEIELRMTGLIKDLPILNKKLVRIPNCYPIYKKGYKEVVAPIAEELSEIDNLQVIGRYGAFKYNNQDHSLMMGLLAADNILNDSKIDLWQINSDFDEYQEDNI